jgi:hypothetical protein
MAQGTMQTFAQKHKHQDPYSIVQIQKGGTGSSALNSYASNMEEVFTENKVNTTESEFDYFTDAIEKNDTNAINKVAAIGASYTKMAPEFIQTETPIELQNTQVDLANVTSRLGADITDLSMMNSDPLRAYLGLSQYQTDATALAKSMSDIGSVFSAEQFSLKSGDPGFFFYQTAANTYNSRDTILGTSSTTPQN